jgi:hypothetical protein
VIEVHQDIQGRGRAGQGRTGQGEAVRCSTVTTPAGAAQFEGGPDIMVSCSTLPGGSQLLLHGEDLLDVL